MKRHESRNISRSRTKIQKLSPCVKYKFDGGKNPFQRILLQGKKSFKGKQIFKRNKV